MKNSYVYYIAGIFDGEGGVGNKQLTITNTHKKIIEITSLYLNKLNILHTIKVRKKLKNYKTAYDIKINGRKNIENFYTYIPFVHRDKRYKMLKEIQNYKKRKVTLSIYNKMVKLRKQNLSYQKIAKKLKVGKTIVFYYIKKGRYKNE